MFGDNPETQFFAKWRVDEINTASDLLLEHVLGLYNEGSYDLPGIGDLFEIAVNELELPEKDAAIAVRQTLSENRDYFKNMGYFIGGSFFPPGSFNISDAKSAHPKLYKQSLR